jgi:drug/metabolite transporter (DMT)-like permease
MNYPILALIVANIIWGAAIAIFKYSLTNVPPFTFLFVRFFFGSLFFLPFVLFKWQKMSRRDTLEIIICTLFGFTLALSFLFLGLKKAPSINFPVIHSVSPIIIYFCSAFFLKEKLNAKKLVGFFTSLFGVMIIILIPLLVSQSGLGEIEGNIMFVLATTAYVVYIVVSKSLLRRINAFQATFLMFFISSLTFIPFMMRELQTWSFTLLETRGWFGLIYGVIFSSVIAYYLQHWAEGKVGASEVGLFTYLDPIITVIIAVPLLGEVPDIYYFIGALLVFAGIFIAEGRIQWHPVSKLRGNKLEV